MKRGLVMLFGPALIALVLILAAGAAGDGGGPWADEIPVHVQGKTILEANIPSDRSDWNAARGPVELGGAVGTFYSLGFGGAVILRFDNYICNGQDEDVEVFEVTWNAYPLERAAVYAFQDFNSTPVLIGDATNQAIFDSSNPNVKSTKLKLPDSIAWARFIKIVDTTPRNLWTGRPEADGFDLTAVRALHSSESPCEIQVRIDIKPGSFPNSINLKQQGTVPVGIFSGNGFDATTIDRGSVVFAGASPLDIGKSPQDINGDGLLDVVFHFATQELQLEGESAVLTGKTNGGQPFYGVDSIRLLHDE